MTILHKQRKRENSYSCIIEKNERLTNMHEITKKSLNAANSSDSPSKVPSPFKKVFLCFQKLAIIIIVFINVDFFNDNNMYIYLTTYMYIM